MEHILFGLACAGSFLSVALIVFGICLLGVFPALKTRTELFLFIMGSFGLITAGFTGLHWLLPMVFMG